MPDLLDSLRAGYHPDSQESYDQTFDHVRNAPVLILDDFGAHSSTAWAQEKLFQIINHRFNARLPTVITTNQSLQKLDDRLYTRLSDPSLSRVYELESTSSARAGRRRLDMFEQPRFRAMTFESFDTQGLHLPAGERRKLADAYRFALDFAQKPEGWLMLTGPHGSGKTHLAVAITNYRRQAGEIPYLVGVTELLHFLRQSRETGSPLVLHQELEEIREIPLLVLDNLDLRRRNPYWDELYPRSSAIAMTVACRQSSPPRERWPTSLWMKRENGWRRCSAIRPSVRRYTCRNPSPRGKAPRFAGASLRTKSRHAAPEREHSKQSAAIVSSVRLPSPLK